MGNSLAKIVENLPLNDRPYEKLELAGPSNLTNSELLAIIIKTGTSKYSCLDIARNILNKGEDIEMSDIEYLSSLSLAELQKYDGIGRVKAIQIKAVIELSKRMSKKYENNLQKNKIVSPADIYNLVGTSYCYEKQECLKTILLNKRNIVLAIVTNAIGSNDSINISLKEIFCEPIKQLAHSIVLVHNHPSGTLEPSKQDVRFTLKVNEMGEIFNIKLLDHVIIANNNYISLKQKGYI